MREVLLAIQGGPRIPLETPEIVRALNEHYKRNSEYGFKSVSMEYVIKSQVSALGK